MSLHREPNNIHPINSLIIASWNAAGLRNKLMELTAFINLHKIDIMIVTETHLLDTDNVAIKGYLKYSANHPTNRRRGGAAIFIKSTIRHISLPFSCPEKIQCSVISVTLFNGSNINIAAAYLQPQETWTADDFHNLLSNLGERFLIAGDWNSKSSWWGNPRSCQRGAALLQCIQAHNYNILATGSPTHFPTNTRHSPSGIDFGIYRGLKREQLNISSLHDLSSDHLPLVINLTSTPQTKPSKCYLLPLNANLRVFQQYLENYILLDTEIKSEADIDDCIQIFERNISMAAKSATRPPLRGRNSPSVPAIDRSTLQLIRERRKVKRDLTTWFHPDRLRHFNRLTNLIKAALKQAEKNRLNRLLESLEPDNRFNMQKLWRITSDIKRQPTPNFPVKKFNTSNPDDIWCKNSEEKAEAFGLHLQDRFTPIITATSEDLQLIDQDTIPIIPGHDPNFRPVSTAEVLDQIKLLKNKKSPGADKIDNRTLKSLPLIAIEYLVLLYNSMLKLGYFPNNWKHANIKMLHKPGKPSDQLSSYRPISLLSGMSKIFETLLLKRMFEHDPFTESIPHHQFGFRKFHGAEQQLGRVTQFILKSFERWEYCSAVYLDIQEAFDRVWHKGLFYKLSHILPNSLYRIIRHYLSDRTFVVECCDGVRSPIMRISAGVPQGSVLGPILYTLYTSDIPAPQYPNTMLVATYADDTAIMSASNTSEVAISRVENYLKAYIQWANKWCVKVNVSKTAHVLHALRPPLNRSGQSTPLLNGTPLTNKTSHTYLGVKLDTKLTLIQHVIYLVIKLRARIKKLHWLINSRSKLPLKTRTIVYKQLIAPIWQYSLPVWGSLVSERQFSRIRVMQNKTLRIISGADWYTRNDTIHSDLNVKHVDDVFSTSSAKYTDRLLHHINPEARKLALNPYRPERLSRPRYYEMIHRCLPIRTPTNQQQLVSSPGSENSPTDGSYNGPLPIPINLPPGYANTRLTAQPAYRNFLATGIMDSTFGDLRTGLQFIQNSTRNILNPWELTTQERVEIEALAMLPMNNTPVAPRCLQEDNVNTTPDRNNTNLIHDMTTSSMRNNSILPNFVDLTLDSEGNLSLQDGPAPDHRTHSGDPSTEFSSAILLIASSYSASTNEEQIASPSAPEDSGHRSPDET